MSDKFFPPRETFSCLNVDLLKLRATHADNSRHANPFCALSFHKLALTHFDESCSNARSRSRWCVSYGLNRSSLAIA